MVKQTLLNGKLWHSSAKERIKVMLYADEESKVPPTVTVYHGKEKTKNGQTDRQIASYRLGDASRHSHENLSGEFSDLQRRVNFKEITDLTKIRYEVDIILGRYGWNPTPEYN